MTTPVAVDLDCVSDLGAAMSTVSGRTCLAQCLARMTITPKGRLIDDPLWGFGVQQYLNDGATAADLAFIQRGLASAYLRDERVKTATVAVSFAANKLTIVALVSDAAGPFRLTIAVENATAAILAISN